MSRKIPGVTGVGNRSLIASLVTLAIGLAPASANAAGLGRINILSGLGQPLVGEIELVSIGKGELSSLAAHIASPAAFRNANIQFNSALVGAKVTIEQRPNGQPYIRISSTRSVDEPYLDLLVELTWNTGRLVREYTALIDPPGVAPAPTIAPPATTTPAAPVQAPAARPQPSAGATATPGPAAQAAQNSYGPVQPGDTLHKIAAGVRPQGVDLDQVLVSIFRSNPDAFIRNNMNLLRTGKILRIPEASELSKVSAGEAANEVRTQSADWSAYRQRVAAAAPEVATGESRAAAGKIATKVDDAAAGQAPGKEVVKISKGAQGKEAAAASSDKATQERIRALEEEVTAREKTLKDAAERIASLEKTIKDMQHLLELKGAVPAPGPSTAEPQKAPAVEGKADVQPAPKPQPKPIAPPPPPPAAAWWEDPTLLGGGLLGLGALGGAAYLLARRRRQDSEVLEAAAPVVRRAPSVAPSAAAAAASGGVAAAAVTTSQIPAQAPAAAPVDDVDPIAEADVYIAYGRDAQAEEILKEALSKTPDRQEIKVKLLEIYAARKSRGDFNALAAEVHTGTAGRGDLWLRAATMGYALDPDNALYAAGKDSAGMTPIGVQTDVNLDFDLDMVSAAGAPSTVTDLPLEAGPDGGNAVTTTILSPGTMEQLRNEGAAQAAAAAAAEVPIAPSTDIIKDTTERVQDDDATIAVPPVDSNVIDFEFDPTKTVQVDSPNTATFDPNQTMVISPENQSKAQGLDVEIDLGSLDTKVQPDAANDAPVAAPTSELSFNLNIPEVDAPPTVSGVVPPTDIKLDVPDFKPADTATMDFALDTVSFNLGDNQAKDAGAAAPAHDDHWYDVQTKFDLAKAYQEMGDKEGAREILNEVIKEGDAQQQAEAQSLLDKIA
jgi:pilus assembly protein FimV